MKQIITNLWQIIKQTDNMIAVEEEMKRYMERVLGECLGTLLEQMDQVIKEEKQKDGWKVERRDTRVLQFSFGAVSYRRTLMRSISHEPLSYPLDDFLRFRRYQRYSPLVEVKVAELASESTYREVAKTLGEWTGVTMSHTTVGKIVRQVGEAQAKEDEERIQELEEADGLPEGKVVDHLFAEADGVFVRSTEKKKRMEVKHGITYEGWEKRGKRVSLVEPKVYLTTKPIDHFWEHVQAGSAHAYSLGKAQIVTNSDGGKGYTAERFQAAFSQSENKVLNQLDAYHIQQGINRAFGVKNPYKQHVKQAIKQKDYSHFLLWTDTYESTLEEDKKIEKLKQFRQYIIHNWDRIQDWREIVDHKPNVARSLGGMESHQRHVTYRMKKRGMHWSEQGAESMVKIKQGMINQTLRTAYLKGQQRSVREQHKVKQVVRMSYYLKQETRPSIGAQQGSISLYTAHSSATGNLLKTLR